MKKFILLFFLVLNFQKALCQDLLRVRSVLDTLCSPRYHGRGYVEAGDKKAAEYISKEFSTIGLERFEKSYFQQFSFAINTFPGNMILKVNGKALIPGKEFIVDASSAGIKYKGRACILDTLIFSNSLAREKFLKQKCEKEILIYRAEDFNRIMQLENKYLEKFHCFKAHISLHKDKLTASVSTKQFPAVTFQVLEKALPRDVNKVDLELEAKLINNYASQNVMGYLPAGTHSDSLIVFTAHYDHLGRMGKNVYFPGANDNASGISLLLELARYYKDNPNAKKHSIVFIAFAGEEAGLLGSRFFVSNPIFPLDKIKFLINLDLVGTGDDGIAIVNATFHDREMKILEKINTEKNYFSLIKKRGEAANSDHYFFHLKGVKSFFIYTLGGIKAYHDVDDRPESLPLTKYSELYQLLIRFVDGI